MQSKVRKQTNKCYTSLNQQVQTKSFHKASDTIHTSNSEKKNLQKDFYDKSFSLFYFYHAK